MKPKVPNEKRKVSTTFAVDQLTLKEIDRLAELFGASRSHIVSEAVYYFSRKTADILEDKATDAADIPDDVSEIGYNPYTGSYEEDL